MLPSLFKSFENMLDSFKFEFNFESTKPENIFKNVEYEKTEETGSDENSSWKSERWTSEDGNIKYYKKVTTFKSKETKKPTLEDLKNQLNEAVKEQKYETAIKLRDTINQMEKEKGQ